MANLDCPTGSASSGAVDTMIYRCIVCTGRIAAPDLHLIHGPLRNKHLHIGCMPEYFGNFEEINESLNKRDHRAYWKAIHKQVRKFMNMKRKLWPKSIDYPNADALRIDNSLLHLKMVLSWTAVCVDFLIISTV